MCGGFREDDDEGARLMMSQGRSSRDGSVTDDGLVLVSDAVGPFTRLSSLTPEEEEEEGDGEDMGRTPAWNITLNTIMYMAVPLSMPATLAAAGWTWGSVWFIYCTLSTYWTGLVIGKVFNADPTLNTYPTMAAEAFARLYLNRTGARGVTTTSSANTNTTTTTSSIFPRSVPSTHSTTTTTTRTITSGGSGVGGRDTVDEEEAEEEVDEEEIVHQEEEERRRRGAHRWRVFGRRVVVVMQFVTFYLDTVTQMIYVAQYFGQLTPGSKICQRSWLLIVWGISVPVMQIPTFHASRWVVVPAMATLSLSVVFFIGEVVTVAPWNCAPGPTYGGDVTWRSTFVSLASFAYAYGGHGMFPEELREMKNPKSWPSVMRWSYAIMAPCYLACMCLGYYAYGDFAQANINLNFPNNWVNTVSIALQLLQCYYLIFYTNVVLVMGLEMELGVDPTTTWSPPVTWAGGLKPAWFRLIARTVFLGSQARREGGGGGEARGDCREQANERREKPSIHLFFSPLHASIARRCFKFKQKKLAFIYTLFNCTLCLRFSTYFTPIDI